MFVKRKDIKIIINKIDELETELFELKYPIGKFDIEYTYDDFRGDKDGVIIYYNYFKNNKIRKLAIFEHPVERDYRYYITSYKIIDNNKNIHIGLKINECYYDNQIRNEIEKYFIIDKENNTVVECNDFVDMNNGEWVEYKN